MGDNICQNCKFYIQHYALLENRMIRIHCGHCTFSSVKQKRPSASACAHFISAPADTERFVSKEYLTKAILDRLLNMELLPEIPDIRELTVPK